LAGQPRSGLQQKTLTIKKECDPDDRKQMQDSISEEQNEILVFPEVGKFFRQEMVQDICDPSYKEMNKT